MDYTLNIDIDRENNYVKQAYKTACEHGFHNEQRSNKHWLILVITEVSEAVEADRKLRFAQLEMFKRESCTPQVESHKEKHWQFCFEQFIKDTVADELADICIRLYDFLGVLGGKLNQKPSTDSFILWLETFGSYTFAECAYELCTILANKGTNVESSVAAALSFTRCWAKHLGVDLQQHIELKMQYNAMRVPLHGKQY